MFFFSETKANCSFGISTEITRTPRYLCMLLNVFCSHVIIFTMCNFALNKLNYIKMYLPYEIR